MPAEEQKQEAASVLDQKADAVSRMYPASSSSTSTSTSEYKHEAAAARMKLEGQDLNARDQRVGKSQRERAGCSSKSNEEAAGG